MNISLIGMSGAGKSYYGRLVAEKLGYTFIDVDALIEAQFGKRLQHILNELGDGGFIKMESKSILELGEVEKSVIAPGGSVVYSPQVMGFLKHISKVVYLDVPFATIARRTTLSGRGIVGGSKKTFEEIYNERVPLYEHYADWTVHVIDKTEAEVVDEILQFFKGDMQE